MSKTTSAQHNREATGGTAANGQEMTVDARGDGDTDLDEEDVSRMGREELRVRLELQTKRVEMQNSEMRDLRGLVTPFKVENVRLARSLKQSQHRLQQVVIALRDFFKDSARRDWFKDQKDDTKLCTFFQCLITWYKKIKDDKNPTTEFYQKVWQYERGDPLDEISAEDLGELTKPTKQTDQPDKQDDRTVPKEKSRRPDAISESVDVGGPLGLRGSSLTSETLYDVCKERTETRRLQIENEKLRQENASLMRANASLERDIQGLLRAQSSRSLSTGFTPRLPKSVEPAKVKPPDRTLAQLAASDKRWQRLLDDPDRLFDREDVIDDMYEQYLSDLLSIMVEKNATFKQAIDIQAEAMVSNEKNSSDLDTSLTTAPIMEIQRDEKEEGEGAILPTARLMEMEIQGAAQQETPLSTGCDNTSDQASAPDAPSSHGSLSVEREYTGMEAPSSVGNLSVSLKHILERVDELESKYDSRLGALEHTVSDEAAAVDEANGREELRATDAGELPKGGTEAMSGQVQKT